MTLCAAASSPSGPTCWPTRSPSPCASIHRDSGGAEAALRKENKDSISYAISTIGEDGYPHSRFVVHRGFVNQRGSETDEGLKNSKDLGVGQAMIFTADIRSEKIKQIAQNRKVELCWWMEPTGALALARLG